jgi:low affinity Fe/Cu permease
LFLIQRSQSKDTLSLQVKLNELLAATHRASPELINIEDRSESEVREIHGRFQEIKQRGPEAHSIADLDSRASAGPIPLRYSGQSTAIAAPILDRNLPRLRIEQDG